ncbi:hypothetical protein DDB_G0270764 [Dictyostelium discoideum AX4]|uniref:Adenine DNA glycosylase n=1 Tax=Dictyostelium discoideum TaxID=44689 RepID=Q1ZXP7_DICDI|nr:hypothetical protein DDB_G0270764 [Dictyostelium discoideum AX4]EAS66941.1 hypothetical protein DDB_G0270764 [Dictyostelium discoideum AX4]|eukprot:XP_001134477.1 hypothetical protein DDB_G0270764 [Dictyostelium discoideum AX4]
MRKKIKIEYEEEDNENNNNLSDITEDEDNSDEDYVERKKKPTTKKTNSKVKKNNTTTTTTTTKTSIKVKDESIESIELKPCQHSLKLHKFKNKQEIQEIRESMLGWYEKNKRDLPWRKHDNSLDENVIAYRVWVSEIMLQQTRVATVIEYFNKWIEKWPTINDLASTTIEEVNKVWSGLGYYRRAKNLWLGSKYVVDNFNSKIPSDVKSLLEINGIGPYTAGAISSIAFNKPVPLVDGNVIRVLSRVRSIGANPKLSSTVKLFWELGNDLVESVENPCNFNQSLMELGATICSVQSPQCKQCPIQSNCQAYQQEKQFIKPEPKNSISKFFQPKNNNNTNDIESSSSSTKPIVTLNLTDICKICQSFEDSDGPTESVCRYPKKVLKTKARDENVNVFLIHQTKSNLFLLTQRPDTGLLASLFEAPSIIEELQSKRKIKKDKEDDNSEEEEEENDKSEESDDDDDEKNSKKRKKPTTKKTTNKITKEFIEKEILKKLFKSSTDITIKSVKSIGTVLHKFSHINQTLTVYDCPCDFKKEPIPNDKSKTKNICWLKLDEIQSSVGVSKQMLKCFDLIK